MKKIVILIIVSVLFFSCADEFLKEKPYSTLSPDNFYNNEQDAEAAILGMYHALYLNTGLFRAYLGVFPESATDLFIANPVAAAAGREMADYLYNAESNTIRDIWTGAYDCIKRANSVIDNLALDVPVPDDKKSQFTGEAKFMRALMYYYLVQLFGDVPLVLNEIKSLDNIDMPRTPADEVWVLIKQDLTDAISALPEKSEYEGDNKARASKGAARMLLAKTHMGLHEWQPALTQIDAIIASNEYALQPDIKTVFQVAHENGLESIFEAQYIFGYTPKLGSSFYAYFCPAKPFFGWQTFFVNESFINQFDKTTPRFKAYFTDKGSFKDPVTGKVTQTGYNNYFLYKFFDVYRPEGILRSTFNDYEFNFRIFRYADVLLMKAECENELNGPNSAGVDAFNAIRSRAGETTITVGEAGSNDNFREIIFRERGMELYGEGHRWYDLKRRGTSYMLQKINEAKGFNVHEYQLLWPLPHLEIQLSDDVLKQNLGWE